MGRECDLSPEKTDWQSGPVNTRMGRRVVDRKLHEDAESERVLERKTLQIEMKRWKKIEQTLGRKRGDEELRGKGTYRIFN